MRIRNLHDMAVKGIITFGAPASGGFTGTLPAGETLLVDQEPPVRATGAWLVPERYEHFEAIFVSELILKDPEYNDYAIGISFDEVAQHFVVLKEEADPAGTDKPGLRPSVSDLKR